MHTRLVAAALVAMWSGPAAAADNQPSYSPSEKPITAVMPHAESFTLEVKSPADPNKNLREALEQGVTVSLQVEVSDFPETGSAAACAGLVTVTPATQQFTAASQPRLFTVSVAAGPAAPEGTCVYRLYTHATGAWSSGGGTTLSVTLSAPTAIDETPPVVTISSPADGASLAYCGGGTAVDVAFEAAEDMSPITAVSAAVGGGEVDVTPTGLGSQVVGASGGFLASWVGSYGVTATATSAGGTGDKTHGFSVNYDVSWLPPLSLGKTAKGGSTVPIKFTARDCNGSFVRDETVSVVVYETSASGMPSALSGVFGEGASSIRIDDVAGQYIVNFQTGAGARTYRIEVSFADQNGAPFKQKETTLIVR